MSTPILDEALQIHSECCTYNVMTDETKGERMHIRIHPALKEDFKIVARLRGLTPSALVHSLIKAAVREEMAREPEAFKQKDGLDNRTILAANTPPAPDTVMAIERRAYKSPKQQQRKNG